MSEWFGKFIENLSKLLDKPPYLFLVFIGAVFTVISLVSRNYFEQTWIFFLYAVSGTIWRYIERDFLRPTENYPKLRLYLYAIYHAGNLFLLWALLHYLRFL